MIVQDKDTKLAEAQLRGPIYIWVGFVCISAYFTWRAYDLTGSKFQAEFPTFNSSNPLMLQLTACSVLNLVLAWILPAFLLRRRGLVNQFTAFVIRMALIGSVVVYGLMCASDVHDGNIILPFSIFAFLGFIRSFPKRDTFKF